MRPWPWQVWQGCSMTVPEPPQRWHGRVIENRPWPSDSTPRPWQTGHTIGLVPGSAPVPRQVGQAAWVATETGTCAPSTAWSKESETVVSRSRPRSAAGRVRAPPRPPVVLKMPGEDVREAAEVGRPSRRPRRRRAPPNGLAAAEDRAAAVVLLALLRVPERVVGLGDLLEAVLRPGVLVGVRVVLAGQLAVGLLDVLLGRLAVDAQDLVVVGAVGHPRPPRRRPRPARAAARCR